MKKKICISFFLALVMVLTVAIPVSGSLDTSSETYYVADDPSNYSMTECSYEESDVVVYDFATNTETYFKFNDNEIEVARSSDIQKYWPGYIPEGMTFETDSYSSRSLIGADNRIHITNTNVTPYSRIACLTMDVLTTEGIPGKTPGTGWMVHKNIVVTAAHTIYSYIGPDEVIGENEVRVKSGYVEGVKVIPGASVVSKDGSTCTSIFPTSNNAYFMVPSEYTRTGSNEYDYGIIVLGEDIGLRTGWFSMLNGTSHSLSVAYLTGYATDRSGDTDNRYMYRGVGAITQTGNRLYYQIDSVGGQSGSPIYDSNYNVVGIHTNGTNNTSTGNNSGVSLNTSAYVFIMNAINAFGH